MDIKTILEQIEELTANVDTAVMHFGSITKEGDTIAVNNFSLERGVGSWSKTPLESSNPAHKFIVLHTVGCLLLEMAKEIVEENKYSVH